MARPADRPDSHRGMPGHHARGIATPGRSAGALLALLRRSPRRLALAALLLNALTQPPANLLFQQFGHFWAIEAGVWLLETALLCLVVPLRPARALLVAGLANGASAAIGLLLC